MTVPASLRLIATPALLLVASLLLAACSKPEPPPTDQQPEPQAAQDSDLHDAIQRPINKAKAVETQVLDSAQQQRADIEAQTGG